jgi:hypothetical protein
LQIDALQDPTSIHFSQTSSAPKLRNDLRKPYMRVEQ